jgi:hypothetical protein
MCGDVAASAEIPDFRFPHAGITTGKALQKSSPKLPYPVNLLILGRSSFPALPRAGLKQMKAPCLTDPG